MTLHRTLKKGCPYTINTHKTEPSNMPSISTKHLSTTRIWKIPCVDFVLLCQFSKWLQNALVNQQILTCARFGSNNSNRSVPKANHVEKQMHKKNHCLRIWSPSPYLCPPKFWLIFFRIWSFELAILSTESSPPWICQSVGTLHFFWKTPRSLRTGAE